MASRIKESFGKLTLLAPKMPTRLSLCYCNPLSALCIIILPCHLICPQIPLKELQVQNSGPAKYQEILVEWNSKASWHKA